jgi:hypothetical protein
MKLTPKMTPEQSAFVASYLENGDAEEAARWAGIALGTQHPTKGCYVYLLLCPMRQGILYVGKGTGGRMLRHVRDAKNGRIAGLRKHNALMQLLRDGKEPVPVVFADALSSRDAFRLERLLISAIGRERLLNATAGSSDPDDMELARINWALSKFKPFDSWWHERAREPVEGLAYWLIYSELCKMRDNPKTRVREFNWVARV